MCYSISMITGEHTVPESSTDLIAPTITVETYKDPSLILRSGGAFRVIQMEAGLVFDWRDEEQSVVDAASAIPDQPTGGNTPRLPLKLLRTERRDNSDVFHGFLERTGITLGMTADEVLPTKPKEYAERDRLHRARNIQVRHAYGRALDIHQAVVVANTFHTADFDALPEIFNAHDGSGFVEVPSAAIKASRVASFQASDRTMGWQRFNPAEIIAEMVDYISPPNAPAEQLDSFVEHTLSHILDLQFLQGRSGERSISPAAFEIDQKILECVMNIGATWLAQSHHTVSRQVSRVLAAYESLENELDVADAQRLCDLRELEADIQQSRSPYNLMSIVEYSERLVELHLH
jgi:hypothetical protein